MQYFRIKGVQVSKDDEWQLQAKPPTRTQDFPL